MSNLVLATAIRTARATAIKTAIDAGSGVGKIKFYTTPMPTAGATITTQTLIATCDLSDPCGTVSGGVLTLSAVSDDMAADNTGTITFARILDSDDNFVADATVGVTGSGAVFILNTVAVIAGGIVRITSVVLTEGNS
jgi:hypothetical protein